ncbi:MAG: 16S rRNA (adenine(1518)-N(6)/adenine(1519)-N(6))-dimethyltransferase RsmA [Bacteroidota bacterium]|nr:16S rRNA (adenine(1518)-N(6)/adenine(1519)-N(6))-dimethyltransferase RsmA [Bacteroidota bacterium]
MSIRTKKSLGQHFLKDENIARKIVDSISPETINLLEIGPGTGVLTKYLLEKDLINLKCIETDRLAFEHLLNKYPAHHEKFILADFLKIELADLFDGTFSIIGNFPYNISSQIFFKAVENKDRIDEVVCMIQKEVAERMAAVRRTKQYGILSVIMQAYFDITYLFTVSEKVFDPPPRVKSAVIKLKRNTTESLACDEKLFARVVKAGFNYRRKTLRNSLKALHPDIRKLPGEILDKRAEELSVEDFVELTRKIKDL